MSGKCVPVPVPGGADEAAWPPPRPAPSPAPRRSVRPHDLVAGDADLGRFLQGRRGHDAELRRMTQSGWATLTRSQVAFWSSPGGGTARCCTVKP